jgi:hypothetical protein
MCDVTEPTPTAGHTENAACCTVADAYLVYRAAAWQRVDQIRHNINNELGNKCIIEEFWLLHSLLFNYIENRKTYEKTF